MVNHITAAIRDNKKASILAPIFVCFEVLFEVLIPVEQTDYATGAREGK